MLSAADFMARAVVWPGDHTAPGWINVHWLSPKGSGMRGRPFKHLHDFMSFVEFAITHPGTFKEIYFCLSTQKDHGKEFHGKTTASGIRFDMNAMVAAHPTYPFGTLVRVTNLANGCDKYPGWSVPKPRL